MSGLGKLLGYSCSDDSLSKALQTLSASDSLDFRALLQPDGTLDDSFCAVTSADSGFENGRSAAVDAVVAVDQLLCELQSVAIEWKSLRQAKSCSCAMPFEHHSKKVCITCCPLGGALVCCNVSVCLSVCRVLASDSCTYIERSQLELRPAV